MNDLITFYENFDDDELSDDYKKLEHELITAHNIMKCADARVAVYSGKRLIKLKKINYGKFEELYKKMGISKSTASNYVLLTKTYGNNPEILEGISQRRALAIAKQYDREDFVRFVADELWRDPEGNLRTTVEVREMLIKDEENKHTAKINTKNKEIADLKSRLFSIEEELETARIQDKDREKILKDSLTGESKTLYEENQKLKSLLAEKDEELNRIKLEIEERKQEELEKQEALEILRDVRTESVGIFGKLNQIDLVEDVEVAAEYEALLKFIGQYLTGRKVRIRNVVKRISDYNGNIPEDLV